MHRKCTCINSINHQQAMLFIDVYQYLATLITHVYNVMLMVEATQILNWTEWGKININLNMLATACGISLVVIGYKNSSVGDVLSSFEDFE